MKEEESASPRREAILDAAAEAFMHLGFAATSVDSIAVAMGQTKGSIYHHFHSKSELFFAVHSRALLLTAAALEAAAPNAPPAERLWAMASAHTMLVMDRLPYLRVAAMGLEMLLLGRTTGAERAELAELVALRDNNERLYVEVIAEGIAQGVFREVDPRLAAKPLTGALNWTSRWYQPRPGQTHSDKEAIAAELADFVVGGLLAR